MKVLQYPLTLITFFFVFGILFNRYSSVTADTSLLMVVFSAVIFFIAYWTTKTSRNTNLKLAFWLAVQILSFSIGNFSAIIHQESIQKNHYVHSEFSFKDQSVIKVVVLERWKSTEKNHRFVAEIFKINDSTFNGKIVLNFRKNNTTKNVIVGSKLAIYGKILPLQKPFNPNQFDYSEFLINKSIYGQIYTDDAAILVYPVPEKSLAYYSAIFRNRVIDNLKNSGLSPTELGVVHALILGQRQDLDPDVLQNYQYAGVIHILSVSGLHVGFLVIFLNFFLNFLPNTNHYRVFKVLTVIIVLWGFALIAGFSPSVVRSVTMFSFVAIGMYKRRKTYIFYTFYCSVLLILLFEPSFLFDVGFQLSYLALFFILWLQPEFSKIWEPKNVILKHLWDVLTITFAAQLGTMPLSLYYFHQFPGLFFLANLMIMFLITIIMGVGLFLVLIAFWTEIPTFIVKVLEYMIWFLNKIVEQIASVESLIFKDIPFNFWMMLSLFLTVFAFGYFVIIRNYKTSMLLLLSILLFQTSYFLFDWNARKVNELIVFQAKNSSLILERKGKELIVFSHTLTPEVLKTDRTIQSYNVAHSTFIKHNRPVPNLLFFNGKKIVILDSSSVFVPDLKPDVVLVTQSPKVNFERLVFHYEPKIVIADASNYKNVVQRLRQTCREQKIPFHAIAEKGFYTIK